MGKKSDFFWSVAKPFLNDSTITKGRLMAFSCLQVKSKWFAAAHHISGDLVVKLSADRVNELIKSGEGVGFYSGGNRFKERVLISHRDPNRWIELICEALVFVENKYKK